MPGVSLSSSEGYAKYLKDQSGIKLTLLNKTTKDGFVPLVDVKDDKKITVADGTEVTYVDELDKQSKSKYLVKYQGKEYRVSHAHIVKPARGKTFMLKPQMLNIIGSFGVDELQERLIEALDENEDKMPGSMFEYSKAMVLYASDNPNKVKEGEHLLKTLLKEYGGKQGIPKTIWNDFSEMIGPIYQITRKNKILPKHKSKYKIYFPKEGNCPLVDYIVLDGKKETRISAKSKVLGSICNTVKSPDIIKLIEERQLSNKFRNYAAFNVLQILDKYSTLEGPEQAISYLKSKNMIPKAAPVKEAHKTLEQFSKNDNTFKKQLKEIFIEATNENIYYNVLNLENNLPVFHMDSSYFDTIPIYLRSKGAGTAGGKMGVQT
jgi:hypothetical protein